MEKRPWPLVLRGFGCMGMRSPWHTRTPPWPRKPFPTSQITPISKPCQKRDALKPLIAPCRGSSGSWMRPYGSSPNGFLTTLLGENDDTRPCRYNYPCWKIGKQLKSNSSSVLPAERWQWQKVSQTPKYLEFLP